MHATPLLEAHRQAGARLVDFAGWEMPLVYNGIIEEHNYTRTMCSAFDVSHMGRIRLTGDGAEPLLEKVCTRGVGTTRPERSRYSHICNEQGGVLDDVIFSRLGEDDGWYLIVNASNREKILSHLHTHNESLNATIKDETFDTFMLSLQGARAIEFAGQAIGSRVSKLPRFGIWRGAYFGVSFILFRSGYTGEDGIELVGPAKHAMQLWNWMMAMKGADNEQAKPAGLGARDTLRIEAGLPLYGHELDESIDPITAGFDWVVDLEKDFVGAEALRAVAERGREQALVGLTLEGKRSARADYEVAKDGQVVGRITSATVSPTLGVPIAMAFVQADMAEAGTSVEVDLRGKATPATVVELPFYHAEKHT